MSDQDPLAEFRACGCLSCRLIITLMEHQAERHGKSWDPNEALEGLATASALICKEIEENDGDAARPPSRAPAGHLHGLVLERIARLQTATSGPARGFRSTIH